MLTRHLMIEGMVQGVGYRYAFAERATALALSGWVRNRSSGAVEASVYGPASAVQQIIDWAHRGPSAAHVTSVTVSEQDPSGAPETAQAQFEIRPTA